MANDSSSEHCRGDFVYLEDQCLQLRRNLLGGWLSRVEGKMGRSGLLLCQCVCILSAKREATTMGEAFKPEADFPKLPLVSCR